MRELQQLNVALLLFHAIPHNPSLSLHDIQQQPALIFLLTVLQVWCLTNGFPQNTLQTYNVCVCVGISGNQLFGPVVLRNKPTDAVCPVCLFNYQPGQLQNLLLH